MITLTSFLSYLNLSTQFPPWVTGTAYTVGIKVLTGGKVYVCVLAHTAGVFATDLAADKWREDTIYQMSVDYGNSFVNKVCNRTLGAGTYTEYFTGSGCKYYPDNQTVAAVTTLKKLNTDTNAYEDYFTTPDTILNKLNITNNSIKLLGSNFIGDFQIVYTTTDDTPDIVDGVAMEVAAWYYKNYKGRLGLSSVSENSTDKSENFNNDTDFIKKQTDLIMPYRKINV